VQGTQTQQLSAANQKKLHEELIALLTRAVERFHTCRYLEELNLQHETYEMNFEAFLRRQAQVFQSGSELADFSSQLNTLAHQGAAIAAGMRANLSSGPVVEGYPSSGWEVVTPAIHQFKLILLAFEVRYALASDLDQDAYMQLRMEEERNLTSWGVQQLALAPCFPMLNANQHIQIYLDGVPDEQTRLDIRAECKEGASSQCRRRWSLPLRAW
jgi:hypothetical protein